jgi:rhodanese-related sulfurtransferase
MPMRTVARGSILPALPVPRTDAMKHFKPKETAEFLKQTPNALLVDCRSEMEYLFVGHPTGALHVAWNDGPDWEVNPHFVGQVKKLAGTNHAHRPILLICRSGNRSLDAGEALERAGFTDVYNVLHGFEGDLDEKHQRNTTNGWRFEGLPWEQT